MTSRITAMNPESSHDSLSSGKKGTSVFLARVSHDISRALKSFDNYVGYDSWKQDFNGDENCIKELLSPTRKDTLSMLKVLSEDVNDSLELFRESCEYIVKN